MKMRCLLLLTVLLLFFCACAPQNGDYFAPFRGEFTARIAGEWQSMPFEAELTATAADEGGARVMTLTFYAPATLSGTVLTRDEQGVLTLAADGISLPLADAAATGYAALLELFPTTGEIRAVTQENGNTRLDGAGFSLVFSSNGTPVTVDTPTARAEVKSFRSGAEKKF